MNKKIATILALLTLTLSACQSTPPYVPYKVEKSQIVAMPKKIGIMPTQVFFDIDNEEEKSNYFHDQLVSQFEKQDFEVITADKWKEIYQKVKDQAGQLYNPKTGKADQEKLKQVKAKARQQYFEKYGVSTILYSAIVPTKASWNKNSANWHGAEQAATGESGFWAYITAPDAYGTVGALSLWVNIEDDNQQDVFIEHGGIQLLSYATYTGFENLPKSELLIDDIKNSHAVYLSTCRFFELWQIPKTNKNGKNKSCRK